MLHTGRKRPTRAELERIEQWWQESHECCPEAIAAEMQQVAPEWDTLNQMVRGEAWRTTPPRKRRGRL